MSTAVVHLKAWASLLRRRLDLVILKRSHKSSSCGEGCYTLADGTLIPLGDLGVTPTEYNLEP